jgi:hypothetical protein
LRFCGNFLHGKPLVCRKLLLAEATLTVVDVLDFLTPEQKFGQFIFQNVIWSPKFEIKNKIDMIQILHDKQKPVKHKSNFFSPRMEMTRNGLYFNISVEFAKTYCYCFNLIFLTKRLDKKT